MTIYVYHSKNYSMRLLAVWKKFFSWCIILAHYHHDRRCTRDSLSRFLAHRMTSMETCGLVRNINLGMLSRTRIAHDEKSRLGIPSLWHITWYVPRCDAIHTFVLLLSILSKISSLFVIGLYRNETLWK